ncbi:MAG: ABC transporter permease [Candidatus Polarisedimenticolaceae bacterium]|nr:ABC transporter permease [Candidatus Polarisedimenticolaceae bacterium]
MNMRRYFALFSARNREFLRDRTALAWNIILPVLLVIGFAFALSTDDVDLFKVGVVNVTESGNSLPFLQTEHIQFIPINEPQAAITKVERHQLDMLFDPNSQSYWINERSANGYILEKLLQASAHNLQKKAVTGEALRYVDWLIPGILGMNIMFSSLFGVGYVIVRYRKNGVLKRLKATPLTAFEFLTAQITSRLWLIVLVTSCVYFGTNLFVGFRMYGSYLNLLLVLIIGTTSMISVGLLVAARMSSEEAANGLLNLISWPMMLLSGVWFSLEGSHPIAIALSKLLPLTHMIDAARAIMIDGATLMDISPQLVTLIAMSIIFLLISARSFRWE